MRRLIWFRADLRLRDNRALQAACSGADEGVLAAFALCPGQWREHDWGDRRVAFVLENLRVLAEGLAERNIPLKLLPLDRFDDVPVALLDLARQHGCGRLDFNEEYEINERRRDRDVRRLFEQAGLEVRAHTDQVLLPPGSVKTGSGGWYSVFTPFRRNWVQTFERQGDGAVRAAPRAQVDWGAARLPGESASATSDPLPDYADGYAGASSRPDLWPAGEDEALSRLRRFTEHRIGDYVDTRDIPSVNGTSTLSPYLAVGVLSPRQCLAAAVKANGGHVDSGSKTGADVWISELVWREFYKHLLVGYPRLSMSRPFRPETDRLDWRDAPEDFEAWCAGRTGIPIVDAAMRQLERTGWMHNRLRMIVAMFLTKNLLIDWRLGERYFMQQLVDGDLAANNGGWQWSASTGTDAAPYFRVFNPTTQGQRFDPDGAFIRKFVPELAALDAKAIHEPAKLGAVRLRALGYPEPICDLKSTRQRAIDAFKALS